MNYHQRNKRQAQLTPRTKMLLKFYKEITGNDCTWEDVPVEAKQLIMEVGFEPIAKVYAKRMIEQGKELTQISIKTGLSRRKVEVIK